MLYFIILLEGMGLRLGGLWLKEVCRFKDVVIMVLYLCVVVIGKINISLVFFIIIVLCVYDSWFYWYLWVGFYKFNVLSSRG